jgi:hypothetical protein
MTDPWDIAHAVLTQLAEQVRKLPPELIEQLYEGSARIEIVPKGGRPAPVSSARRSRSKPVDVALVSADLSKINDRAAATRYVKGLNIGVAGLVTLADALGIPIARKPLKARAEDLIVQWTVGRRADSDAISRPAPSRF